MNTGTEWHGRSANPSSRTLDWFVSNFVRDVPGVSHAILVSADGLLMASSSHLPGDRADLAPHALSHGVGRRMRPLGDHPQHSQPLGRHP